MKYEWLSLKIVGDIHIYFYHSSISPELLELALETTETSSFPSLESVSAHPRGWRFAFFLKTSGEDFFWFLPIFGGSAYSWLMTASFQPLASSPHTRAHMHISTHTHAHTPHHTQYNFKVIFEIK